MKTTQIYDLIELAEQGSDPQEIETGQEARKELTAIQARLASAEKLVILANQMIVGLHNKSSDWFYELKLVESKMRAVLDEWNKAQ